MKIFSKKVDLRSRKQMIEYLKNHYRYNTMNSWNQSTSYANNVKIYNLDFSSNEQNKLYELVEMSEFYDRLSYHFYKFARKHNFYWQAGFNGRSGGYIGLYQGFSKKSEYKSYCTSCGQRNYKTIEETGNCRCGKCGRDTRVNYSESPMQYGTYPGKSVDMYEDFEDWDIYSLRQRVSLVLSFDKMCDDILAEVKNIVDNYEIDEEIVYVPQTIKRIREAS